MNLLLEQIRKVSTAYPRIRKRLVAPEISAARELIRTLALSGADTTGWEAANLRLLAEELSYVRCAQEGKTPADDIRIASLINRAIDEVAGDQGAHPGFERHAEKPGFREAVRDALLELRTMGVSPDHVARAATRELTRATGAVLIRYEALLENEKLLDPAAIFRAALDDFDTAAPHLLQGIIVITPGIRAGGLRGDLLRKLIERGAVVMTGDVPNGISIPTRMSEHFADTIPTSDSTFSWLEDPEKAPAAADTELDIFAASTPYEEVREVLRRALIEGRRWDEVELVTTDPDTYGIALDAICERLDIGMTSLRGIPLRRTRIGRSLARWLSWISDGLPADMIRAALESEELTIPGDTETSTARLAPLFRTLQVGWGRERYEKAIGELTSGRALRALKLRDDDESPENEAKKAAAVADTKRLRRLLFALIDATPIVPERGNDADITTSTSELASAALKYLNLLRARDDADRRTLQNLRDRLVEIAEAQNTPTTFALAMSGLEDGVDDLRAWSAVSGSTQVLSSQGGKLFLTDIANAGLTGRSRTFVLGLDAETIAGSKVQDPVLLDSERLAIDPERLASSAERREDKRYLMYRSLASLRGKVTLSFAVASEDGRQRGPAHVLLQALRLKNNDPLLGFRDLHEHVMPPACAVTNTSVGMIDSRDAWLAAIGVKPVLADGRGQVEAAFAGLASGLTASRHRIGTDLTSHHGLIPASAGRFDPRSSPDRILSPSSLELLARCPLAWFYKYGAEIAPPVDPEYSPEMWLDALERGSLLHSVLEEFGRAFVGRQDAIATDEARDEILRLVETQIAEWKARVPPPDDVICQIECEELRSSALSFLAMERKIRTERPQARWREFELAFGGDGVESRYALADGSHVRVRGRVDRIDDSGDGGVIVIDYKTGKAKRYGRKRNEPPFKGGRQLQPAIYAEAVQAFLGVPVERFEYWFPTPRGENQVVPYGMAELAQARPIVEGLLNHIATGEFLPTSDSNDCRFCDFGSICRTQAKDYSVISPLAEWAKANQHVHPQYASMRSRRGEDE